MSDKPYTVQRYKIISHDPVTDTTHAVRLLPGSPISPGRRVMDAPVKIRAKAWMGMAIPGGTWSSDSYKDDEITEYIRADLADKLIGYAVHDGSCARWNFSKPEDVGVCTCGLSDLIREVRGE